MCIIFLVTFEYKAENGSKSKPLLNLAEVTSGDHFNVVEKLKLLLIAAVNLPIIGFA